MKNIINEKPEGFVNPDDQRGGPNCGVTAIAIAMGITFKQSWELHKRVGKNLTSGRAVLMMVKEC